jgi:hypothetical protein
MYDAAETGPLPGYFGILFLGRPGDPLGQIRSYQRFSGSTAFQDGGDPTTDAERYELLSSVDRDPSTRPGGEADFRFLISAGPVPSLPSGRTVQFQAAMVIGNGLEGMLRTCAEAAATWYGSYFNLDGDPLTGIGGRETKECAEWWPIDPQTGRSALFNYAADYMDVSCVGPDLAMETISEEDLFIDENGYHCIWVNRDNCEECNRRCRELCTRENNHISSCWDCPNTGLPCQFREGCTGICGAESQVDWIAGMAPPPPSLRLWQTDNAVHIFWDDISEHVEDYRVGEIDFESYRIWRADNWKRPFGSSLVNGPESGLWRLLAEYDVVNHCYETRILHDGSVAEDTMPLGFNTGLDPIAYRPVCLDDPRFAGLQAAMQIVVDRDSQGQYAVRPPLRDRYGDVIAGLEELLPWEGYPTVLDTFFMVTARQEDLQHGIQGKRAVNFYHYVDSRVHNGFIYFYSVTATDHRLDFATGTPRPSGGGLCGAPSTSFSHAVPGADAQTPEERQHSGANIYVYPNPATVPALNQFQRLQPNADDPTGMRVMFANLPRARNTIAIFTLDGDLVAEIQHDGTSGYGQASWNLVSRNGQQIVSGVYFYVVNSDDERFEDSVGKFVVIR